MSNGLRKLLLITATLLFLLLSPIFENVLLKNDKNPQAAVSSELVPSTDARATDGFERDVFCPGLLFYKPGTSWCKRWSTADK